MADTVQDPRTGLFSPDLLRTALGHEHREDAIAPRTGGSAGNAQLTAWTGLVLLVLFAAEGVTLLSVRQMLTWHIVIGALLIPPVLLKTATTTWRMLGYYGGRTPYRVAGPPPLLLRLLGPLVVLSSLAVVGTGVALLLYPHTGSEWSSASVLGLSWKGLHKLSFIGWFGVMTVHVLGRLVPALQLSARQTHTGTNVPGLTLRGLALIASVAAGVACAYLLLAVYHR